MINQNRTASKEILLDLELSQKYDGNALSVSMTRAFNCIWRQSLMHALSVTISDAVYFLGKPLCIQPVFNRYKAITYMWVYLPKIKGECSHAMSQAF